MPRAMRQLAVVQFFTWFALFCMWLYFVPAVATKVFHGAPGSPEYQRGNEWGGVCFAVYNGMGFVFAGALLALVRWFTARSLHRVCLLCGGGGLILAFACHQQYLLLVSMLLVGVAWASILSMPYAMLSNAIPAAENGLLHGRLQLLHRHPANPGLARSGRADEVRPGRQPDERRAARRLLDGRSPACASASCPKKWIRWFEAGSEFRLSRGKCPFRLVPT